MSYWRGRTWHQVECTGGQIASTGRVMIYQETRHLKKEPKNHPSIKTKVNSNIIYRLDKQLIYHLIQSKEHHRGLFSHHTRTHPFQANQ